MTEWQQLDVRLFTLGGAPITLFGLLWVITLIVALVWFAGWLRNLLVRRLLVYTHLDSGTRTAIGAVVRYTILGLGLLAVAQTAGINLTTFNVLAGAAAVGVGFGLQNLVSNFVSGLIIMLERPIKVGDRIEVAGVEGTVEDIGTRRTTILTNDNIAIIVPNQRFLTDNVVKLAYLDSHMRLRVVFNIQTGADPQTVTRLLIETAVQNEHVLDTPPPTVHLLSLAGPMKFELQVWSDDVVHARERLLSELNFAVLEKLSKADIKLG